MIVFYMFSTMYKDKMWEGGPDNSSTSQGCCETGFTVLLRGISSFQPMV